MSSPAMQISHPTVSCSLCGWVHFGMSAQEVLMSVTRFNHFYDSADENTKRMYGARARVRDYLTCNVCGASSSKMRPFEEGDCPNGCTIGPILLEIPL